MKGGVFPGEEFPGLVVVIDGGVYLDTAQITGYYTFKNDVFPFSGRQFNLQGIQLRPPQGGDVRVEVEVRLAPIGELLPDRLLSWIGQRISPADAHIAGQFGHGRRALIL